MTKKPAYELKPIEEVFMVWDVLTPDERQFVRNNYTVHHFKINELIQSEGEISTHMMILAAGKAKVYKDGIGSRTQIIRMLKPGENFGYRAIIANEPNSTNVAAFEASTVYMLKLICFCLFSDIILQFAIVSLKSWLPTWQFLMRELSI
jgi:CRP-like cAMP-binding protein